MFSKVYQSENRQFMLYLTIKCEGKLRLRVWAEEYQKKNSKYADREIEVDGERTIHLNFPISPNQLFIGILDTSNPQGTKVDVQIIEGPLKTYNIWMDEKSKRFVNFAERFCTICGYEAADDRGRAFKSSDGEFMIRYFNTIRNPLTGAAMNTPASIGHDTGIIYAAKNRLDNYTIPMRIVIFEHEYSHKYKNPKIGLKIEDEEGADINALYMYLGMGFSKIDAICVFANVFLKAQTASNMRRMRKIMDYINKFENLEYAQLN